MGRSACEDEGVLCLYFFGGGYCAAPCWTRDPAVSTFSVVWIWMFLGKGCDGDLCISFFFVLIFFLKYLLTYPDGRDVFCLFVDIIF